MFKNGLKTWVFDKINRDKTPGEMRACRDARDAHRKAAKNGLGARSRMMLMMTLLSLAPGALAACGEDDSIARLEAAGHFEPAKLNFGEVPAGLIDQRLVKLVSEGPGVLSVDQVDVPEGFAVARADDKPLAGSVIGPGADLPVAVSCIGDRVGEREGTVIAHAGEIQIPLQVSCVVDSRLRVWLTLEPRLIDFGPVDLGGLVRQVLTFRNLGNAPGQILNANDSNPFDIEARFPLLIPPGATATAAATFRPTAAGRAAQDVDFMTADGANLQLMMQGVGRVAPPPPPPPGEFSCQPMAIDFGLLERGMMKTRTATCAAQDGPVDLTGVTLSPSGSLLFSLPMPPNAGSVMPGQPLFIPVGFNADGATQLHQSNLLVAYRGMGGAAAVDIPLRAEVVPPRPTQTAITVTLTWQTQGNDIDLHFVRPNGQAFSARGEDCHYANRNPDWGVWGKPYLDQDNTNGPGRETMNWQAPTMPSPGVYRVYVHYYAARGLGNSSADVQIYLLGQPAGTFTQNLACDRLWHVANIDWNGSSGTLLPVGSTVPAGEGLCP